MLFLFIEGDYGIALGIICSLVSDDLASASRALPMCSLVSKQPFPQVRLVVSPSKFPAILSQRSRLWMHHTSGIGRLVCGVSRAHEDACVMRSTAINQPGAYQE